MQTALQTDGNRVADLDPVLARIVARVVERFDPLAIYLFGSRAAGTARPDSDYDILMVLPDAFPRKVHPFELYETTRGLGVPIDLLPCRHGWFMRFRDRIGNLGYEAHHHGRLLYRLEGNVGIP